MIASVKDAAALRAAVFGPFRLLRATGDEIDISNRRARALLGMLALAPGEGIDRDHISKLLWPGRFEAQARASLRQCLLELGRVLDPDTLETDRQRAAIRKGTVLTDLGALEAALSEGRADTAIALLSEIGSRPLLDQIDLGEPFAAWLADQRRHIEGRLQIAVERALAELKRVGHDEGHVQLEAVWRACARSAKPKTRDKVRIAILPLEQHDETGGPLFLAEGVGEELQSRLSGIAGLAVIGRTSVSTVFQAGGTLPEMARRLQADYLLEGTAWRFADRVRISIGLIDGKIGTKVWSDTYDGAVEEMLTSRHALGGQAIAGLCKAMRVEAHAAPARTMTSSREAYALYLQGRALTLKGLGEGVIDRGIELLEQALEIDPKFAECWTALSEAHVYHCLFTPALDRPERAEKMADCARRALELDPCQGHARYAVELVEGTASAASNTGQGANELLQTNPFVRRAASAEACFRVGNMQC